MNFFNPLATLTFGFPVAFILPGLVWFALWTRKARSSPVPAASAEIMKAATPTLRLRMRKAILGTLATVALVSLSIAAARPQQVSVALNIHEARNLILALDVSRSMLTEDFDSERGRLPRLEAVKSVVAQFVADRRSDRIGLVVFGSSAYVQSPLTLDHDIVVELVKQLDVGIAGDGTAIGDGLGLSLKRLREVQGKSKAVVLLTDGVSNSGQVNPKKAAQVAAELGITVHTVGVGSTRTITDIQQGAYTQRRVQEAEYDEATLRYIAETTGGVFFNASSIEGLRDVYKKIDQLERTKSSEPERRTVEELFSVYAKIALVSFLLFIVASRILFRKVP